ncbi:MAG: restriction endonuclease subunit S [Candidatus Accumulibacter necessarius]|uniref:restriction endonuclease subunit S n=1 Tax=Candidatus Accumulibacter necessarius TaxID=2954386 RepID=UPI002FC32E7C
MNDLPDSWAMASLAAVSVDCEQRIPAADATFQYIDIASIDRATKSIVTPQTLLGRNAPSRARKVVRTGDVLVSMTRPNLNAVSFVPEIFNGQIASTGFDVLRSDGVEPRWLFYLVRTEGFVQSMSQLVQGALYPAVRSKDVRGYEVPIAPLNEQKRIADKLDALLARVDACRERLDRVPAILKRFRQSVLSDAMVGNLTAEWRREHPTHTSANDLAAKLHYAHQLAGGHKLGNAAPPTEEVHNLTAEMFPKGWELVTLRDLVMPDRPITYGILKPGPEIDNGIPYVRVADFPNERLNITAIRRTSPSIDQEFKRSRLRSGDLLLSIRGTVGRVVLIPPEIEGANITQDSARLTIQSAVNPDFVLWYLRSELAQARMSRAVKGVAVRGINIGDVRALQTPLPHRHEQDEIVRRVETLFASADRLEARYAAARAQVVRLTPALLAKAFRGELVPQDPDDEPANVLLERIRAARAAVPPKARSRKDTGRPTKTQKAEILMLNRQDIRDAHLCTILRERGPLTAEALWSASQLDIDDFYDQLKDEEARGLLNERRGDSPGAQRLLAVAA